MTKLFSITSRVYYQDTDAGGVIYHSKYLDFCERARTEFLREKKVDQIELMEKQNIMFVVKNLNVDYVLGGQLDDLITITAKITEIKGVRIKMKQEIIRKSDEKLLSKINLELVCINKNFRPVRIPEKLIEKLK